MKKIVMLSAVVFAFVLTANMALAFGGFPTCGNCQQQQQCPCPETRAEGISSSVSANSTSGKIEIERLIASKINALTGTAYAEAWGSTGVNVGVLTNTVKAVGINSNVSATANSGKIEIENISSGSTMPRTRCFQRTMPTMSAEINAQTGASQAVATGFLMVNSMTGVAN